MAHTLDFLAVMASRFLPVDMGVFYWLNREPRVDLWKVQGDASVNSCWNLKVGRFGFEVWSKRVKPHAWGAAKGK